MIDPRPADLRREVEVQRFDDAALMAAHDLVALYGEERAHQVATFALQAEAGGSRRWWQIVVGYVEKLASVSGHVRDVVNVAEVTPVSRRLLDRVAALAAPSTEGAERP